jgi:hypothetical protein
MPQMIILIPRQAIACYYRVLVFHIKTEHVYVPVVQAKVDITNGG